MELETRATAPAAADHLRTRGDQRRSARRERDRSAWPGLLTTGLSMRERTRTTAAATRARPFPHRRAESASAPRTASHENEKSFTGWIFPSGSSWPSNTLHDPGQLPALGACTCPRGERRTKRAAPWPPASGAQRPEPPPQLEPAPPLIAFTLNVNSFVAFFTVTAIVSLSTRANDIRSERPFGDARR